MSRRFSTHFGGSPTSPRSPGWPFLSLLARAAHVVAWRSACRSLSPLAVLRRSRLRRKPREKRETRPENDVATLHLDRLRQSFELGSSCCALSGGGAGVADDSDSASNFVSTS